MAFDTRQLTPDSLMQHALSLARAQLGQTWPNPAVGAVIIKDGTIIAEAATAPGGRPHAETIALAQAGENARGATMVISLEPCSHHGKTPPCVDAIITAGIAECMIACRDPNPKVEGIDALTTAGIKVSVGVCEMEAQELNRGFFSVIQKERPYIAMKIATSKDGKIAATGGTHTQITGEEAFRHTQNLRAEFDAILTGIGTVLADDPLLTVRISGMEHRSPVRVVLDSQGRLPTDSNLKKTEKDVSVWIYKREDDVMRKLTERGITRLLIEAGQAVNTSFLQSGLVDRIYWYQAPHEIGANGLDAVAGGLNLRGWKILEERVLGDDKLTVYEKDGSSGQARG